MVMGTPGGSSGLLHDFLLEGLPAARAGLAAAREARAAGAGPDAETLRSAYLDVLKLCLCDLGGSGTISVGAMAGGQVVSRELRGDEMRLRCAGMDWPLHGLTMVGLGRLDDLQSCVESVVRDGVPGDLIEAGAWRGGAAILMRATLDSLGERDRTVWVADSFEGFPSDEAGKSGDLDLSGYDFLVAPLPEVRESFARFGCERGVHFVPGIFEETLPGLSDGRWAIVRLDGDTYEATKTSLEYLYPGLSAGGYVIVDDYRTFEGCREAVDEFRREHAITEPLEDVDFPSARWRREHAMRIEPPPAPVRRPKVNGGPRTDGASRPRDESIPTARELELTSEVAELRGRLGVAEAELQRMLASPRQALAAWLRRRLRRGA
jgi:O-methyltransferase